MKFRVVASILALCFSSANFAANQVQSYAKKVGVKSCLKGVSDIEKFFADGINYGSWTSVASEQPNNQLVNASLELTFNNGTQLIDLTVTPQLDNTCSYTYTRTWFTDKNCMAVQRENFMKGAKYKTQLNKNISAFSEGEVKYLLMPAGNGCVVQKKETGFRFTKFNS